MTYCPGQPPCHGDTALPLEPHRGRSIAALASSAGPLILSGCVQGPLSTLDPASEVTRSVAALWWSMAAGTGIIFLLMVGLAALALRRNPPYAPGRKGVLVLLIGGGLVLPSVVILALLAFGLRLDQVQWPPGVQAEAAEAFHADVIAHQWWWEARYPAADGQVPEEGRADGTAPDLDNGEDKQVHETLRTVNVLHVPVGVPIHLRIMASDVIHGFWVPRLAGKLDAVPGKVNRIRLMVEEPGEYAGVCAEYCGVGHTHMRFTVIAHPAEDFASRLADLAGGQP